MRFHRIYLVPALGLMLVAATACSSGSSSSSSAPATSAPATSAPATTASAAASGSAVSQITANWEKFFNSSTPNSERVQLLENGSEFTAALTAFSASPLASAVTSKVDSVTVTSATQASVKYDLSAAGTTVASGATGSSVLQNGTWKVGDDVFCGLLKEGASILNIKLPAACSSAA
jgi:hypothetical protein